MIKSIKPDKPIYLFKGKGHTHDLGKTVSLQYRQKGESDWNSIYRYNVSHDQNYHDIEPVIKLEGEIELRTQCTYNSSQVNTMIHFGPKHSNEMCISYFLYYSEFPGVNNLKPGLFSSASGGGGGGRRRHYQRYTKAIPKTTTAEAQVIETTTEALFILESEQREYFHSLTIFVVINLLIVTIFIYRYLCKRRSSLYSPIIEQ